MHRIDGIRRDVDAIRINESELKHRLLIMYFYGNGFCCVLSSYLPLS